MSRTEFRDIRHFETIDSTNTYLLAEARNGALEGAVAVAAHQSAGKGRLGRKWEAPPEACLLTSILLRPVMPVDRLFLCTAAVALAALSACQELAGVVCGLKWPNDLVYDHAKLAGVLAESDAGAPGGSAASVAVVVGIGINIDWPGPPGVGGTSLGAISGRHIDRLELLEMLLDHLVPLRGELESGEGRRALALKLAERCVTIGQDVRIETATASWEAKATGITEAGHLVTESGEGRREVSAGDVVHLRPAGSDGPLK